MNKLILWVAGFTKVGKAVKSAQTFLDGKKQMLAALGTAVAGTLTILATFSKEEGGGLPYLAGVASTPEFLAASGGWISFFNALGIKKARKENAEIIEKLDEAAAPTKAA
jgi:hypothetical protein